jgi:hemerythrin
MGGYNDAIPLLEQCLYIAPDDQPAHVYLERCRAAMRNGETTFTLKKLESDWSSHYSVGSGGIDHHHEELLALMGKLAQATSSGAGTTDIAKDLMDHMHLHFGAEENLLRRYEYPFIAQHQRQHQAFQITFEKLISEIAMQERSTIRLLLDIQLFMVDWYINHITKSDAHLGHFLQRAGVS